MRAQVVSNVPVWKIPAAHLNRERVMCRTDCPANESIDARKARKFIER